MEDKDEVTLQDIWLVIREYKTVATGTVVLSVIVGLAFVQLSPSVYEFKTAIEIGTQFQNDEIIPIEPPITVLDKLKEGYIPQAIAGFVEQNPSGPSKYAVATSGSEDSQVIGLLTEARLEHQDIVSQLHESITQRIISDHDRTINSIRADAQTSLARSEQVLGQLVSEEQFFTEYLADLDSTLTQLDTYTEDLRGNVSSAEKDMETAENEDSTERLLLQNQIGEWRAILVGIENAAKVNIFATRSETEVKLDNIAKEKAVAQDDIEYRKIYLENIKATRVLGVGTVRSLTPVFPDKPMNMATAVLLGLILACVVPLVLNFLRKAEKARHERPIQVSGPA